MEHTALLAYCRLVLAVFCKSYLSYFVLLLVAAAYHIQVEAINIYLVFHVMLQLKQNSEHTCLDEPTCGRKEKKLCVCVHACM